MTTQFKDYNPFITVGRIFISKIPNEDLIFSYTIQKVRGKDKGIIISGVEEDNWSPERKKYFELNLSGEPWFKQLHEKLKTIEVTITPTEIEEIALGRDAGEYNCGPVTKHM